MQQWLQYAPSFLCVRGSQNAATAQGSFLYTNSNTARGEGEGGSNKGERENSRHQ